MPDKINMVSHILLFIVGIIAIIVYNHFEKIASSIIVLISFIASWGAIIWNSYRFFDDKKWKKDIEKIKFLNQKSLEIHKIYVSKKMDNIICLYEAILTTIVTCDKFRINPVPSLYYDKFTENDFKVLWNEFKITNITDQNDIISYWEKNKLKTNFNAKMQNKIRAVIYSEDSNKLSKLTHSYNRTVLYLKKEDSDEIKELVISISDLFMSLSPAIDAPFNTEKYDKINDDFDKKIIPMLKKALTDVDDIYK